MRSASDEDTTRREVDDDERSERRVGRRMVGPLWLTILLSTLAYHRLGPLSFMALAVAVAVEVF
jgi:hypothetical protein